MEGLMMLAHFLCGNTSLTSLTFCGANSGQKNRSYDYNMTSANFARKSSSAGGQLCWWNSCLGAQRLRR
jgi:hypothetical protein